LAREDKNGLRFRSVDTEKNVFAATGFRILPFLDFCLLIGVPRQTAWLCEGHSEIELREMKACQPIFQAKLKKGDIITKSQESCP